MWRRCLWRTGVWMGWRRLRWNRGGTLENVDLGKKMRWSVDGGAIGGGLSSDAPRLPGEVEGCRPGGAVGVPWGCHEAAADPHGCEPSPGKVESTRRARSIRSAVPSLRRRRRRWGSAATVSPAGTTGRLSSGVIKGVSRVSGGCVGGTGLTSIDNASRRVATGRWLPPSRPTPSGVSLVGQRSAARCRRSGWKRCPV